ncbi:MAG TPA: penicillin acylase family protein [Polyangiaceae bacterium]|nr:penicillin acylase family protein [Polyangiaceae bacterium]
MRPPFALLVLALAACAPREAAPPAPSAPPAAPRRVTIARDDWGIPHVRGATDADAVFGLMYAQAEDDFPRIETNYLSALGRLAEAEGEAAVFRDLRAKLFVDPDDLKARYASSPAPLRRLMDAWAEGLNAYLAAHPEVHPRVIARFEPWMALSFSEGSIGGDIETVSLRELEAFYGGPRPDARSSQRPAGRAPAPAPAPASEPAPAPASEPEPEPTGSNAFALAGSRTASGKAMLLINPHTSFFFRAEAQVTSGEGLNAYGAITWGQFFVYQGFNERLGWMHTSSGADVVDEYAETIERRGDGVFYRYGAEARPIIARTVVVPYRTATGLARREFTTYRTHHGPIVRAEGGRWVSVRLMNEPVKALTQSFTRTKAADYRSFRAAMTLYANSSNNTVYADADGNIAYFHPNFVPKRDPRFDWTRPVDGSDPATEWRGVHAIDENIVVLNPRGGWLQNTNNWPFSVAGADSPKPADWPSYMDTVGENPRGRHALRVLEGRSGFTLEGLVAAAFDSYLTGFETLLPALLADHERLPASDPRRAKLAGPVAALRAWNYRWAAASVPTTLAVFWGEDLWQRLKPEADAARRNVFDLLAAQATPAQRLASLAAAVEQLDRDFGTWQTPWGEVNRFQRLTGDLVQPFDDAKPSLPVPFTSGRWGSLASFGARRPPGAKTLYGTSGNSFVAVVEFGERVRARAVTAGGASGDPASRHFNDQAGRYAAGDLREVYFYPEQLEGHLERTYRPAPPEGRPERPSRSQPLRGRPERPSRPVPDR